MCVPLLVYCSPIPLVSLQVLHYISQRKACFGGKIIHSLVLQFVIFIGFVFLRMIL